MWREWVYHTVYLGFWHMLRTSQQITRLSMEQRLEEENKADNLDI